MKSLTKTHFMYAFKYCTCDTGTTFYQADTVIITKRLHP
jgi:hypothetical protein